MPSLSSARRRDSEQNIGPVQRGASLLAGSTLVAVGLRRRGVGGAVVALAGADLLYRGATGYCHLLGAFEIDTNRRRTAPRSNWVEIQRSITIHRPRIDVYGEWREPQNQALVWKHFAEITNATDDGAHWRVDAPLGRSLQWETRIVEDHAAELIRWESTGGDLPNEGTVEFRDAPGEYGTEITLRVRFDPPFGPLGDAAARVFDDAPKLVLAKALRRFKSLVEAGEVASTDRNPTARQR